MKKILLFSSFLFLCVFVFAQSDDIEKLHENAKAFMRQGDYANASLILTRALAQAPNNIEIAKDLAFDYYLQKENKKALATITPLLEKDNADDQTYQIGGTIYRALGQDKDAEKLYKAGIKNYPHSGQLYNDYGEMLWSKQDYNAIKLWEKGIQQDPSYGSNYYNASKYYFLSPDKIWSIIYGEIFINIESFTARTAEIKNILLSGYKKLFADPDLLLNIKDKNKFEIAFLTTMNKQNSVVINGLNAETLTMVRTRFILDWNQSYAKKFPFTLFDKHEQLLEEGLFPAYNQWIFGAAQNLSSYQTWISTHAEEYAAFNKFQQGRIFKIPEGQYYH
ncbi:tetratricopeptide repeat protein [Ginsengibacter hankyongi]|uniref:Tetratricopeptide repeat protein n=1 Tax=Ginsengibacter hankyongi TaxID=2607284 RepID=A0A5J5IM29_9BACT|nr:tetratricopeptide repeat protein [Ginsengibacter hankyongi]KAA9042206.1 tetratricopeptide repeat protein [Ginsengibacter hankyongi]